MERRVVIRFDIDTHKCIRDGVPALLRLSREKNIPFTFFLNTGRAVSLFDSVCSMVSPMPLDSTTSDATHLRAIQKLGRWDFFVAAILNPRLGRYSANIRDIVESGCELGLHGGRNHASWHRLAHQWGPKKIQMELEYGLEQIRRIIPDYEVKGFASPGWNSSEVVLHIAMKLGIKYVADLHGPLSQAELSPDRLPNFATNIVAEPGGVAYFENKHALGKSESEIVAEFVAEVQKHSTLAVVYDHPYFAGVHSIGVLSRGIDILLAEGVSFTTFAGLLE